MKKVLLVTLYGNHNFGNRLQNYALQKVVESYGFEVTTLDSSRLKNKAVAETIKYVAKTLLSFGGIKRYEGGRQRYLTWKGICKFNREEIKHVWKISKKQIFCTDLSEYFLAIAGSDQIWHKWEDNEDELPYYYLQFMPAEKRVAYAASFGFEEFPREDIEQHRIGLNGMKEISCREESGCRLVEELTGRQVPRVLDPTLLLSAGKWREMKKQSNRISKKQEKYAFSCFLGEKTEEYRKYIVSVMAEKGIENLIDLHEKKIGTCGPFEFLDLIDNAQVVFTDSFHCTVFSILFDKDFTVFHRIQSGHEKMFGRIEDLLSSTDQLDCIYGGSERIPQKDFAQLHKKSMQYIEMVLGISDED